MIHLRVQEAHKLGDEYLALEKFVNLNYMVSCS
jgi:hypothetical protein